ncbi:MAG: hypothetical protein WC635_09060 [Bacteriovorax sp.]|jgi:proteic killer suppression protein
MKDLTSLPGFILDRFQKWVQSVEENGLLEVRKTSGFHDEPLQGKRLGFRSIRLNRSYRAIYIIRGDSLEFVEVCEVNKHDY